MRSAGTTWIVAVLCLGGMFLPAADARAVELGGSVFVSTGTNDSDGTETDVLDQRYALTLHQRLTDYLVARLGYRRFDFSSQGDTIDFERRSSEPRLELIYARPKLFGSLIVLDRATRGSSAVDDYDTRSLIGNLSWEATERLDLNLRVRDEDNTTDVAVFGRNTDTRYLQLGARYRRLHWGSAYSFQRYEATSRANDLQAVQDRHELRLDASRRLLEDRLILSFNGELTRIERHEDIPAGTDLADALSARQGLAVVDASPDVGMLDPVPMLIDGDLETPADPPIEIGDAFTFRNVGVDLGLTLPVTRLEIVVDRPSDPDLVWQVWHSADNVLWEPVGAVERVWDSALLRYVLRFPETTDRFFKAVNTSVNRSTDVAVTEVRALRDLSEAAVSDRGEATLVRADVAARFRPHERVSGGVTAGISQDEGTSAGVLRRDFEDVHYGANLAVDLPADLRATASYRFVDFENRVEPVLVRQDEITDAGLRWRPLETFEAGATYSLRDESDDVELVRSTETRRLFANMELLPDLNLDSSVEWTDLDDPLGGQSRSVFAWHERVEARPTIRWTVAGGFSSYTYETRDGESLLDRTSLDLRLTWRATPYLQLSGDWNYSEDTVRDTEARDSLRQSYSVAYSPGTKLNLSASYQEYDDGLLRETVGSTVALNYRVNPRFRLFGNLTRSETTTDGEVVTDISSFRAGLAFFF